MVAARIGNLAGVVVVLGVFGGCQMVGPIAIDAGRERYNSIIQSTTKQQAFANIVRVHNNEPTSFMDVTEVDATQTFSGTVNGAATNIGARMGTSGGTLAGEVGSITPGVTYSESPLIRYVPLVGQGLVEQLVAPINTDALASLLDSEWPILSVLDLSTDFLTLDFDEYGAAINIMAELDYDERIELASTKSDWTKPKNPPSSASDSGSGNGASKKTPTSASTDDALVVYYSGHHPHARGRTLTRREAIDRAIDDWLWARFTSLYHGTQAKACASQKTSDQGKPTRDGGDKDASADTAVKRAVAQGAAAAAAAAAATAAAADQVAKKTADEANGSAAPSAAAAGRKTAPAGPAPGSQNCAPGNAVELRTMPVTKTPNPFTSAAPLMRTYSALGVLRNATQPPNPKIGFVPLIKYQTIIQYWWNDPSHTNALLSTYTLLPEDQNRGDEKTDTWAQENADDQSADNKLQRWRDRLEHHVGRLPYVYMSGFDMSQDDLVKVNQRLEQLRRYILIIDSEAAPPANAYVSFFDHGHWYYIDGEDQISQRNFNLIVLFLTVMAYPSSTAPLTTSISVGGG